MAFLSTLFRLFQFDAKVWNRATDDRLSSISGTFVAMTLEGMRPSSVEIRLEECRLSSLVAAMPEGVQLGGRG